MNAAALLLTLFAQQSPADLAFLPGTWAMEKDGFTFTVTAEAILDGNGYRTATVLDENGRTVETSIYTFDIADRLWTQTLFTSVGQRSTFVGVPSEVGVALEQRSFDLRPLEPVRSRLLFADASTEGFTLDWQSRASAGDPWTPRAVPYTYVRVERPAPPTAPGRIAFISNRTGNWDIFTMAPDGSDLVNVTSHEAGDHYPNWIAGGQRLAFRSQRGREDGGWDRWEVDADGTDAEYVPMSERLGRPEFGTFPEVHPSGSYVVYAAEREGEQELYLSRFDGGGERPLAHAPGLDYRPLWSPDGGRVLFVSERDGNPELYVVGADGSNLQRLTESPGIDRYARWSPDGAWIVYASDADTGDSLELYLMRADGSELRRLTENDAEDGEPCWSPDGRFVVFRSNASGDAEVCVVEVATGEITNLTNDPGYDAEPVWSPVAR